MPQYLERKALSPIDPAMISRERIERLFKLDVNSFGLSYPWRIGFSQRKTTEDYNGYFIPRAIRLYDGEREQDHVYYLVLLDDEVDARLEIPSEGESPWSNSNKPDISAIERYWKPIIDKEVISEMVQVFEAIEEHALDNHYANVPDEEKLSIVPQPNIDLGMLSKFCKTLGAEDSEINNYAENHIILAATDPKNYLAKNKLVGDMTLSQCRNFSWRNKIIDSKGAFSTKNYICEVDWKADAGDVSYAINLILAKRTNLNIGQISLSQDDEIYSAEHYLNKAAAEIQHKRAVIVFVDNVGDSYIFTLLDESITESFVSMGKSLGLDTNALLPPKKKGWFSRILG